MTDVQVSTIAWSTFCTLAVIAVVVATLFGTVKIGDQNTEKMQACVSQNMQWINNSCVGESNG